MTFDLSKGINVNLALAGKNRAWLAGEIGKPRGEITRIGKQNWANKETIESLAAAFDMRISEFVRSCEF